MVRMPSAFAALLILTAISPRLAMKRAPIAMLASILEIVERLARHHRVFILDMKGDELSAAFRHDRREGLHHLDQSDRIADLHRVALSLEGRFVRGRPAIESAGKRSLNRLDGHGGPPPAWMSVGLLAGLDEALAYKAVVDGLRQNMRSGRVGVNADCLGADRDILSADGGDDALLERAHSAVRGDLRFDRLVVARDDQPSVVGVVEIDVEFRDEAVPALRVHALVLRVDHAEEGGLEDVGGVADRVGDLRVARRHSVQRAVRLDVMKRHSLRVKKALERTDLVDEAVRQLVAADLHLTTAEPLSIGQ